MLPLQRIPKWRQTPPAIFPVTLGFLGLGLAWRNAAPVFDLPLAIGDVILGLATAFYLFFALSYLAKIAARPGALWDDLKTPPGRAGVSALPMSLMLVAAAGVQHAIDTRPLVWAAIMFHMLVAALVLWRMAKDAPETRGFSPFQFLTFVGLIVVPVAGVPLGMLQTSFWLGMVSLVAFFIVAAGYGRKFIHVKPPVPLRASVVITLAPLSLFALMFGQFRWEPGFAVFYGLAMAFAVVLLLSARWLTKGGWNPVWGAFTFPITAFANMNVMALQKGYGSIALVGLYVALAIGTPLILYIVWRHAQAWAKGELQKKTAAAIA